MRTVTSDGIRVFELSGAVPLVRLAATAAPVDTVMEGVQALLERAGQGDWAGSVVYNWEGEASAASVLGGGGQVTYVRPTGGHLNADVRSEGPELLVFNESYDPGWRASVNGAAAKVLRVNAVVQGVVVPAGRSRVEFRYRPRGLVGGAMVSAGAIILLAVGFGRRAARGRPPQPQTARDV
ncbi:MAG: YfhO family protein [Planctomycetes bacterium]|nr:YfhO family protein [Planctomycetota bacterium]